MTSGSVLQLFLLACLAHGAPATDYTHLLTSPHNKVLEIATNFTATCTIINTSEVTVDDLYWVLEGKVVPKEQYIRINESTLGVVIPVTLATPELLLCRCKNKSLYVQMHPSMFHHGIVLKKGRAPKKPENLACMALQEGSGISPTLSCKWDAQHQAKDLVQDNYTLFVKHISGVYNASTTGNSAQVTMNIYPNHMPLEIWVEASNVLGRKESDVLMTNDANIFVKTNPPSDVQVISEDLFASSLLTYWTPPIPKEYLNLMYEIRFSQDGSGRWTYVPPGDIAKDIHSFRLQNLQPDTVHAIQMRCKYYIDDHGYWSDWSTNATQKTPEGQPSSSPDLWKIITDTGRNERRVQFVAKDPESANGNITKFSIGIQVRKDNSGNGSWEWKSIPVHRAEWDHSSSRREVTLLTEITLPEKKWVKVNVTASNAMGTSPEATLGIPARVHERDQVEKLSVWPHEGHLQVQWKPPANAHVTEFVVEWITGGQVDWQRENKSTTHTVIRETLESFACYSVSVYPIYSGWIGKAARMEAYVEQGVPSKAPEAALQGDPGRNEATVRWTEIPEDSRRGFITNYTLFYGDGQKKGVITFPANTTSHTLTSLLANTKYDVWIQASTIKGSVNGSKSYFTTLKYAPGEIEGIVLGVSAGFFFVFLLTLLLCVHKKDVIKKNFWPEIPNPGESTIGNWSPDCSLKAETPKENCLSGISVLDVDVCDTKCVFEEDKASLTLKKDKYQSEEHSSGIGGSSCMSSPRQSVSDSDEGGDMADTTASTVQYSSVVASSGYKGQTPSSQAQQTVFSRSESTQPLLDSEENPDVLVQEGSRAFGRFSGQTSYPRGAGNEDAADSEQQLEMEQQEVALVVEPLDFCPLEEEEEAEQKTAAMSSYMPQLGGYRPQ